MAVVPEQAVREYLIALRDPEQLRDDARVEELTRRLEATKDPLERLQLRAELAHAQAPDTTMLERNFVVHAKAWADERGVSAAAFEHEGVSRDVLRKAGFDGGRASRRRSTRARRPRVSREDVLAVIPPRRQFTIGEVAAKSGASSGTTRKVVGDLLAAGDIEEVGVDEDHRGPGRAPTVYKRVRR